MLWRKIHCLSSSWLEQILIQSDENCSTMIMQQLEEVFLPTEKAFRTEPLWTILCLFPNKIQHFLQSTGAGNANPVMYVSLICKTTVSVIECCRRKHCSSTVAFNLQYLKSLCSYQRQLFLLISARQTAKQETTAWLMNPSIPICQHKSVSVSPACPQPFALWRVCWALHLIRLRTGWQHTPHSQIFLAGHWTLSLAYTVRQKGISDSFLFSCSIVNFIGCKSQRVHLHFHVQYQGLPSGLLGMRQAQIIS